MASLSKLLLKHSSNVFRSIAEQCEGYSYDDLYKLCQRAANFPIREAAENGVGIENVKPDEIRPLVYKDLVKAASEVRASCNKKNVEELKNYAKKLFNFIFYC